MKCLIKQLKCIAYLFSMLILFQSCVAYTKQSTTIKQSTSKKDMPVKITTKEGDEYKLTWIEEKDGNIVSIKNVKREYFQKKDIFQYVILEPKPHTVPLEIAVKHNGIVRLLSADDNHTSHEFIKISENDEIITGYKMTSKDTLTVIIPIDEIEMIQLKDKGKSSRRTVGAILGIGLAGLTLAAFISMIISMITFEY